MSSALRFDQAPRRVYWELTQACDLACRHCRAEAAPELKGDLGQLRRLARSGLAAHDDHRMLADRARDLVAPLADRQRLGVGDRRDRIGHARAG